MAQVHTTERLSGGLRLLYGFAPTPNPVRASATAANPAHVDVLVLVEPTLTSVTLAKIEITIPVGAADAMHLSSERDLPGPVYDTTQPWSITSSGSKVTLVPASGEPMSVTSSVWFTLPAIAVNECIGVVPITVTEYPAPPGQKTVDDRTYRLEKLDKDFPVTDFHAEPAALTDLEQPVTLYWACTDDAKDLSFSAYAEDGSWSTGDCLGAGDCLGPADGVRGVTTAPVTSVQPAPYALDVIRANADGSRTLVRKLHTTVRVDVPQFAPVQYQRTLLSGRIVRAGWIAVNAGSCSVQLDGTTVDAAAPADTYTSGYLTCLAESGVHQLSVTANARTGPAQANLVFPIVKAPAPPPTVAVGAAPRDVVISPDGKYALVACGSPGQPGTIAVLDIAARRIVSNVTGAGTTPACLSVASRGAPAILAATYADTWVYVLSGEYPFAVQLPPIPLLHPLARMAVSGDGAKAVVSMMTPVNPAAVAIVDVASRRAIQTVNTEYPALDIVVTKDGSTAVLAAVLNVLYVVKLSPPYDVVTISMPQPLGPGCLALTRDEQFVFVTFYSTNQVAVVNLRTRAVETTMAVGITPMPIAISPDGKIALVGNYRDNTISVIDVATRRVAALTLPAPSPVAIRFAPDGSRVVSVSGEGALATLL